MSKTVEVDTPDVEKMKELKIMVVGDGAVGKVSLRGAKSSLPAVLCLTAAHHRRAS